MALQYLGSFVAQPTLTDPSCGTGRGLADVASPSATQKLEAVPRIGSMKTREKISTLFSNKSVTFQ